MGTTMMPTMLLLLLLMVHRCAGACNAISLEDIKDAVYASTSIYDGYGSNLNVDAKLHDDSDYTVTKTVSTKSHGDHFKAIVAKNSEGSILVAFRGSTNFWQKVKIWISGMWAKQDEVEYGGRTVKINAYFHDAIKSFDGKIRDDTWTKKTKYIITGHSLGGALASLFSIQLADDGYWNNADSSMITLGAPRVGNYAYAHKHDGLIHYKRKLRLIYNRDRVAQHPENNFLKKTNYRHHNTEVWIKEGKKKVGCKMKWITGKKCWTKWSSYYVEDWRVCRGRENDDCSKSVKKGSDQGMFFWTKYNMKDHRNGKYIGAIENLMDDAEKSAQFRRDQCNM